MAGLILSPVVFFAALIFVLAKIDYGNLVWPDFLMLCGFFVVLGWLALPGRNQAPGHQKASEKVAFRLGKALNRVWRGNSRGA